MRRPSLVASDVDGTLLSPAVSVTERTAAVVSAVIASGTPFVLVSGRPPRWIPQVAAAVGASGYAVCDNGAVVYHIADDRVVRVTTVDPPALRAVAEVLDELLPDSSVAAERIGRSAYDPEVASFVAERRYVHLWGDAHPRVCSRAEVLAKPVVKLLVRHPELTSQAMATALTDVLRELVEVTFSAEGGLVELTAPGVDKATGLRWVAGRLGVRSADVLAFGDMPNDLPLLRWAGHGVAMANAHPDVRAAADEVTASNAEDGVAAVLERWW